MTLLVIWLALSPPLPRDPAWWWMMCIDRKTVLHSGDCGSGYVKRHHVPKVKR